MIKVLVVEDDPAILRGLADNLRFEGYEVFTAQDGEAGARLQRVHRPDLIVLDLMMPRVGGLELCRRLRGEGVQTPILMLTAKSEEADRVKGLDLGADDYVTKPFGIDELLARVRAALRRSGSDSEVASFDAGDFRVDLEGRRVHARGQEVRLTPEEFDLFGYVARHPNRVITPRALPGAVGGGRG